MYIFHTSIPVRQPRRVAEALAKLFGGATFDFLHPECYFVLLGDPGALIELYRKEIELHPGDPGDPCQLLDAASPPSYTGSHTAVRVSMDAKQVMEIAAAYGWRAEIHRRKVFRVIEFWIENEYLLEVFPPDFAAEYLTACSLLTSGEAGPEVEPHHPVAVYPSGERG